MSARWDDFFFLHVRKFALGGVALLGFAGFSLFGGCEGDRSDTTSTGKVTSAGKPVVFGTVTVIASDQQVYTAPIRPDGTYELTGLPPGPVQIAVSSPNPRPKLGPATPVPVTPKPIDPKKPSPKKPEEPPKGTTVMAAGSNVAPPIPAVGRSLPQHQQWFPIPGKYADPNTSGLKGAVGTGSGPTNVNLD